MSDWMASLSRCTWTIGLLCAFFASQSDGRRHKLELENDDRHYVMASSFGFQQGGLLTLTVTGFRVDPEAPDVKQGKYGFTVDKSRNFEVARYYEKNQDQCVFAATSYTSQEMDNKTDMVLLEIISNPESGYPHVKISKTGDGVEGVEIYSCSQNLVSDKHVDKLALEEMDRNTDSEESGLIKTYQELRNCSVAEEGKVKLIKRNKEYYFSAAIWLARVENEGAYSVFYHNCFNYVTKKSTKTSATIVITERNGNDYLSIGERFSPVVHFVMSALFFGAGFVWAGILRKAQREVYKVHYVMLVLVMLKATSLLCHGVNFHFISTLGHPLEGWAILFYITHLLKGALLFITLVLIGTGWAFIKNFLTNKEKRIFVIVIPLQGLANIAWIIIKESETGDYRYSTWSYVFMLVDFFCCGCILIPIVWSIRHLSEAAGTDGKAAQNLTRMRLFRRYYMLVTFQPTVGFFLKIGSFTRLMLVAVAVMLALLSVTAPVYGLSYGSMLTRDMEYNDGGLAGLSDDLIFQPLATPLEKRAWRQGPADECKSYAECRGKFVTYLENLRKMAKGGRR